MRGLAATLAAARAASAERTPTGAVVDGGGGGLSFGGGHRFVTLFAGGSTAVAMIDTATGTVQENSSLRGSWGIPQVSMNGDTGGLSLDGRVLVLGRWPAFVHHHPQTTFAVLTTRNRLRLRSTLTLPGWVGFDALSPDGRRMYVTQAPGRNPLDYRVRTVDLVHGRVLPGAIVDPRDPEEKMQGYAVSRTWSADGLTAYTLYTEPDGGAFVHALHTDTATAECIDLPGWATSGGTSGSIRLAADGRSLEVLSPGGSVMATVNPV